MMEQSFNSRQKEAINKMKEMNSRSIYKEPEKPESKPNVTQTAENSLFSGFGLPFLDKLKTDGDLTLILGILLLLLSEKADKRLLFALIYILL